MMLTNKSISVYAAQDQFSEGKELGDQTKINNLQTHIILTTRGMPVKDNFFSREIK